jgi:hypothetical protein
MVADVGIAVLSAEEINKAFSCFEQVLSDQKRMGWPNGIPVICINGTYRAYTAHKQRSDDAAFYLTFLRTRNDQTFTSWAAPTISTSAPRTSTYGASLRRAAAAAGGALALSVLVDLTACVDVENTVFQEDKQILKFMDWCLFLTDNKLCHVVFVRDHRPSRNNTTLHSMHACGAAHGLSRVCSSCVADRRFPLPLGDVVFVLPPGARHAYACHFFTFIITFFPSLVLCAL